MDCLYFAFGDTDIWGIVDMPDDASAAALSLTVNASGAVAVTLVPLLTAEDLDAASKKSLSYRPPGS